jgi:hypothetical protein
LIGLIAKLRSIGINGSLLTLLWFESYLTGRQQRVIIEGTSSEWINVKAEVPQGSVLGPLLFVIYSESPKKYPYNNRIISL